MFDLIIDVGKGHLEYDECAVVISAVDTPNRLSLEDSKLLASYANGDIK
jgi:hypothetical protein